MNIVLGILQVEIKSAQSTTTVQCVDGGRKFTKNTFKNAEGFIHILFRTSTAK